MRLLDWIGKKVRRAVEVVSPLSLAEAIERAVEADLAREPVGTGEWDVVVSSKHRPHGRPILRGVTEGEANAEVKRWWDKWGVVGEMGDAQHGYIYDDYSRASFYRRGDYNGVVCTWGPEAKAMRAAYLASLNGKPEPPACGFDIW